MISNANQSTRASSYALLCNENILEWTVASGSGHSRQSASLSTTIRSESSVQSVAALETTSGSVCNDLMLPSEPNSSSEMPNQAQIKYLSFSRSLNS